MRRMVRFAILLLAALAPAVVHAQEVPSVESPDTAASYEAAIAAFKAGDIARFMKIMRPLAEQGDATAQVLLGRIYSNGNGVPKNDVEAMKWWRLAAEQGDAEAYMNIGATYLLGKSVPQNDTEAAEWIRLAAELGNAQAQYMIGAMYQLGQGVPQSFSEAYMWFNLAASQSFANAAEGRDKVAKKMTPADILEAQGRAKEWFEKHKTD